MEFDISAYVGEVITVDWRYTGMLGNPVTIDDILIMGSRSAELNITEISGGWAGFGNGAKVTAVVENIGEGNATEVEGTVSIVGNGLFQRINFSDNGTCPDIPGNGGIGSIQFNHTDKPWRAFCIVNITVHVWCAEGSEDTKSVTGFLFIFYIFITGELVDTDT